MYSSGPVAMAPQSHPRHYAESSVAYHPRSSYAASSSSSSHSYPPRRDAPMAYSHDAYGRPMPSASSSYAMVPRGVPSAYEESLISPMHQQPTYIGYIKTAADAILLLSACDLPASAGLSRGACPPPQCVTRRLLDSERASLIRSGSVFAWDEKAAGMRRWTDGKCWSASRVSGCFLTYRELEVRKKPASSTANGAPTVATANQYKVDGLIKQSFTLTTRSGRKLHVISYYTKRDFREGRLRRVSEDPRFVGEGGGEWGLRVDDDEFRDPTLRDADAAALSPASPFNALHPSPRALLQHAPLPSPSLEAPSSSRQYYSAYDLPSPPSSAHDANRRSSGPISVLGPVPAAAGMKRSSSHNSRDDGYMAPPPSQRRRDSSTYSNSGAEQSYGGSSSEPRSSMQSGISSAATTVSSLLDAPRPACDDAQSQQQRRPPPLQLVHSAFGGGARGSGSPSAVGALLSLRSAKSVGSPGSGPSPRLFGNMPLPSVGGSHSPLASPTSPLPPMLSTSDRSALNKLTVRL